MHFCKFALEKRIIAALCLCMYLHICRSVSLKETIELELLHFIRMVVFFLSLSLSVIILYCAILELKKIEMEKYSEM